MLNESINIIITECFNASRTQCYIFKLLQNEESALRNSFYCLVCLCFIWHTTIINNVLTVNSYTIEWVHSINTLYDYTEHLCDWFIIMLMIYLGKASVFKLVKSLNLNIQLYNICYLNC